MKFMGLLGIVFFLGLAFVFSKNRKAINWHTIIWGLILQALFALIMLGSSTLSVIAMAALLLLITVYFGATRFAEFSSKAPGLIAVIASIKMIAFMVIGYFAGVSQNNQIISSNLDLPIKILWLTFIFVWIIRKFVPSNNAFQKLPINTGIFLLTIGLSFGATVAVAVASNFTQGTIFVHLQNLSTGIGDFLTIPTSAGTQFMYGQLADMGKFGFIFAIHVLSSIIFFSAFISILYYLEIIQVLIIEMAKFMRWTMKTSGAETLSCSANVFIGQTEAPILIKPFVSDMTESELHAIMTGGFATIAGGVFAGFVAMGIDPAHLLGASVMSAPAALLISKIWYPEVENSTTTGDTELPDIQVSNNIVGAAAVGTIDGIQLALNVGGMLIAFVSLIKLINMGLGSIVPDLTLEAMFGQIFKPLAFIMGVPIQDIQSVGSLLGMKIAVNEFVAYINLAEMIKSASISPKAQIIATYALCGFANFASIAIQVGGISYMAPNRRADISRLGVSAMMCGAFASWITACIAGIFLG